MDVHINVTFIKSYIIKKDKSEILDLNICINIKYLVDEGPYLEFLSLLNLKEYPRDLICGCTGYAFQGKIFIFKNYLSYNGKKMKSIFIDKKMNVNVNVNENENEKKNKLFFNFQVPDILNTKFPIISLIELTNSKFVSYARLELNIWNYKNRTKEYTFKYSESYNANLYFHKNKKYLIIIRGQYIRIMNLLHKQYESYNVASGFFTSNIIFNSNKNRFYVGLHCGYIYEYILMNNNNKFKRIRSKNPMIHNKLYSQHIKCYNDIKQLVLSKTQNYLFSSVTDITIYIWNLLTNVNISVIKVSNHIKKFCLTSNNLLIVKMEKNEKMKIKILCFYDNTTTRNKFKQNLIHNPFYDITFNI